ALAHSRQDLPCLIGGAIVDGDPLADRRLLEDVAQDYLQGALLVEDGDHHREKFAFSHRVANSRRCSAMTQHLWPRVEERGVDRSVLDVRPEVVNVRFASKGGSAKAAG